MVTVRVAAPCARRVTVALRAAPSLGWTVKVTASSRTVAFVDTAAESQDWASSGMTTS